jgi:hypothetical protein
MNTPPLQAEQQANLLKVEIDIIRPEGNVWQWLGRMSESHLRELCELADKLSDSDTDSALLKPQASQEGMEG